MTQLRSCIVTTSGRPSLRGTTSKGDWRVVPGTGTGGMAGIQGDGGFVAEHGPAASYHLNLTFE